MAEIVNLRQARKRAAKAERDAQANENRIAFGLPKALKHAARVDADRARARLDGARRPAKPAETDTP